jgi:copper homeostasis protein (lipoprotein)
MLNPGLRTRVLAAACAALPFAATGQAGDEQVFGAHGLALPASFTGTLPCADCDGIEHHLDLFADQTYQMRRVWQGRAEPLSRDEIGRWHADPGREAIVLAGAPGAPQFWQVAAPDRVRLMTPEGAPIVSDLPYDLAGGPLSETDLSLFVGGMLTYMADAAVLTECVTGRTFPVRVGEGDWLALERAYLAAAGGGTPVYATLGATLAMGEPMEGPPRRMLTVDRFVGVFPGQTCEQARAHASLTNTWWRIATLGALEAVLEVGVAEGRREPFIVLREDGSMNASVGCNMILGRFEREGDGLSLGPLASTMMACPEPLAAAEAALSEALGATEGYIVAADTLVLLDAAGDTAATLRAVYLP